MLLITRWLLPLCLIMAALITLTTAAGAGGGVPLPAPTGTVWQIVAGYNTGSHGDHDGGDPHAIDIVRTDASGDWSPVWSPVDGVISWLDGNCLTIQDGRGYAHLLCHISPAAHVHRNMRVRVGDEVGYVFPAGYDANGGIAHIHYAIHASPGDGILGRTVQFTGDYALEGRDLAWRDEGNLHYGLEFTSSNTSGWTAPPTSSPEPPAREPSATAHEEPHKTTTQHPQTIAADAPLGGWRAVGVREDTTVTALYQQLSEPIRALVVHNPQRDTYERLDPSSDSSGVRDRWLMAGQAVWALVEPDAAWLLFPPPEPRQVTVTLFAGVNLISWQGPDREVAAALDNVAHLSHAYQYDPRADAWRFWSPNMPDALNTLSELSSGDALYLVVRVGSTWTQLS